MGNEWLGIFFGVIGTITGSVIVVIILMLLLLYVLHRLKKWYKDKKIWVIGHKQTFYNTRFKGGARVKYNTEEGQKKRYYELLDINFANIMEVFDFLQREARRIVKNSTYEINGLTELFNNLKRSEYYISHLLGQEKRECKSTLCHFD